MKIQLSIGLIFIIFGLDAQISDSISLQATYQRYYEQHSTDRTQSKLSLDSILAYTEVTNTVHSKSIGHLCTFHEAIYNKSYSEALGSIEATIHSASDDYKFMIFCKEKWLVEELRDSSFRVAVKEYLPKIDEDKYLPHQLGWINLGIGYAYYYSKPIQFDSVKYYFNKAASNFEVGSERDAIFSRQTIRLLHNLAILSINDEEFVKGLDYCLRALNIIKQAEKNGDFPARHRKQTHIILASLYHKIEDNVLAKENLLAAYAIEAAPNFQNLVWDTYMLLIDNYLKFHQLDSCQYFMKEKEKYVGSLDTSELRPSYRKGLQQSTMTHYIQKAGLFQKLNQFDSSLYYIQHAIDFAKIYDAPHSIGTQYGNIAAIYNSELRKRSDGERGKLVNETVLNGIFPNYTAFCKHLLELSNQKINTEHQLAASGLAISYAAVGDYKKAFEYSSLHQEIKDSLLNASKHQQLAAVKLLNERKQNQQQLDIAQLEFRNTQNKNRNRMMLVGLVSLSLLGLALILYRNYKVQRKINNEIRKTKANLEQSNRRLSRFVHSVSHDIIGKLESMLTSSNFVQMSNLQTAESKKYYYESKTSATWLKDYCQELLVWSDEDIYDEPNVPLIPMLPIVEDVLKSYKSELEQYGFDVSIGSLPDVQMEQAPLRQIMSNLVSNAIKYSRHESEPRLKISAISRFTNDWTIEVKDNGTGVPKEQHLQIFKGTTDNTKLHGRGLSYLKELLLDQEETIWVDNNEWGGASFYFTLRGEVSKSSL